jgi:hypothetical protein
VRSTSTREHRAAKDTGFRSSATSPGPGTLPAVGVVCERSPSTRTGSSTLRRETYRRERLLLMLEGAVGSFVVGIVIVLFWGPIRCLARPVTPHPHAVLLLVLILLAPVQPLRVGRVTQPSPIGNAHESGVPRHAATFLTTLAAVWRLQQSRIHRSHLRMLRRCWCSTRGGATMLGFLMRAVPFVRPCSRSWHAGTAIHGTSLASSATDPDQYGVAAWCSSQPRCGACSLGVGVPGVP